MTLLALGGILRPVCLLCPRRTPTTPWNSYDVAPRQLPGVLASPHDRRT